MLPGQQDPGASLLAALADRAFADGLYLIGRIQHLSATTVVVNNGRTEEIRTSERSGLGMHLFTAEGHCAFGNLDGKDAAAALGLYARTARAAAGVAALDAAPSLGFLCSPVLRESIAPAGRVAYGAIGAAELEARLLELNRSAAGFETGLSVRTAVRCERESWLVVRSDGTEVSWVLDRAIASHGFTASTRDGAFTCRAAVSSPHFDLLEDPLILRSLDQRARAAAQRARLLPAAGRYAPSGPMPILIDHALAKGLAHEAFGHAAEADSFRSSVLARDGRFRAGERVAPAGVSVIDEPIRGDHADQPVSPNGERRRRVEIIRDGVLHESLSDLHCTGAGHPSRGCDRAESYASPPVPRMSNIRIEMDDPAPLPRPAQEMGPRDVAAMLGEAGVFDTHRRVAFLSGYTGGQVNPVAGDFTFNCQALYELAPGEAVLHRPSSFRGSILGALESIRSAFGPLQLDAIGTCGKWGQSVPSCGGSHAFVLLGADPRIGLGA